MRVCSIIRRISPNNCVEVAGVLANSFMGGIAGDLTFSNLCDLRCDGESETGKDWRD